MATTTRVFTAGSLASDARLAGRGQGALTELVRLRGERNSTAACRRQEDAHESNRREGDVHLVKAGHELAGIGTQARSKQPAGHRVAADDAELAADGHDAVGHTD